MTVRLPISVDVDGHWCCVVGGGRVAEGRARSLSAHGALVRVVSPQLSPGLEEMRVQSQITDVRRRAYRDGDLDGCRLAVAATDRRDVNARVARDARSAGVWCNVADDPAACDFVVPAVVRRGPLTMAVTTGDVSPAAAAEVRARLETAFGPEWTTLMTLLERHRDDLRARFQDPAERSAAVRPLLGDDVLAALAEGRGEEVERRLARLLRGGEG